MSEETIKQEQGEPLEYWNAVEGWVKLDEVREHFDSVSCGTIYKNGGEGRVPLSLAQPKQEQGEPLGEEAWATSAGGYCSVHICEEDADAWLLERGAALDEPEVNPYGPYIKRHLVEAPQQRKPPEWYAQWIRNNYQDYPNIAILCDEMTKAAFKE
jgi:hypothetical protein